MNLKILRLYIEEFPRLSPATMTFYQLRVSNPHYFFFHSGS